MTAYTFEPIGRIVSCFTQKFGIPRQPGLVPEARAVLEIAPAFRRVDAFRGLEAFSHIWIIFVFHSCNHKSWNATVRPPRLGGNQKVGVFATRSGFRPNPIGQSVVQLIGLEKAPQVLRLHLGGVDLLDSTPVLDVKPYIPYADSIPQAKAGYAQKAPDLKFAVQFTAEAGHTCRALEKKAYPDLEQLIRGVLACDPRPAYYEEDDSRRFGMRLWDLDVKFRVHGENIVVEAIETKKSNVPVRDVPD